MVMMNIEVLNHIATFAPVAACLNKTIMRLQINRLYRTLTKHPLSAKTMQLENGIAAIYNNNVNIVVKFKALLYVYKIILIASQNNPSQLNKLLNTPGTYWNLMNYQAPFRFTYDKKDIRIPHYISNGPQNRFYIGNLMTSTSPFSIAKDFTNLPVDFYAGIYRLLQLIQHTSFIPFHSKQYDYMYEMQVPDNDMGDVETINEITRRLKYIISLNKSYKVFYAKPAHTNNFFKTYINNVFIKHQGHLCSDAIFFLFQTFEDIIKTGDIGYAHFIDDSIAAHEYLYVRGHLMVRQLVDMVYRRCSKHFVIHKYPFFKYKFFITSILNIPNIPHSETYYEQPNIIIGYPSFPGPFRPCVLEY